MVISALTVFEGQNPSSLFYPSCLLAASGLIAQELKWSSKTGIYWANYLHQQQLVNNKKYNFLKAQYLPSLC